MAYQDDKDNLWAVIRILVLGLIMFGGVIAFQTISFRDAGKIEFTDIPAHEVGGKVTRSRVGVMQKTTVYDFTERTFQSLHRWKYDGSKEYEKNIRKYENVLTPDYKAFLRRDFKRRLGNNISSELKGRTRMMLPLLTGWDEDRVKVLATKNGKPSAWVVLLDMELIEKLKGQDVKHLFIRYPIRVALDTSNPVDNPWFLALDGYQDNPKRLSKELDDGEKS